MKTLKEIKEGIAFKEGYGCWKEDMLAGAVEMCSLDYIDSLVDKVANEVSKALLEEGIKECDFWMNSPSEGEFEKGMDYGCKTIKEKLSSLIPKEQ